MSSLWSEVAVDTLRPAVASDLDVDVAIVGAGYTGLWTALHLVEADPTLRIAVLEARRIGHGASGRNGGWCSAILPMSLRSMERRFGFEAAVRMQRSMFDTVDLVGDTLRRLNIEAHWAKGGTVTLARDRFQYERAEATLREFRDFGFGSDRMRLLDPDETRSIVDVGRPTPSLFQSSCAAIHPRLLVDGLAREVERRGVRIFEESSVSQVSHRRVLVNGCTIRASRILVCTEAYASQMPGGRRSILPLYSLMIATEPLDAATWRSIGLVDRSTFADFRHLIVYGQRTADDRLAFGGRGAPYHFGSRIRDSFDLDPRTFDHLRRELVDLFPVLGDVAISHRWGGPLGAPRDWTFRVSFDPDTGIGRAGGYVGDGVATSNLAGRTLGDLVLGRRTELTESPVVGLRTRKWEPEPLRWLAVNSLARAASRLDSRERHDREPSRLVRAIVDRVTGG